MSLFVTPFTPICALGATTDRVSFRNYDCKFV